MNILEVKACIKNLSYSDRAELLAILESSTQYEYANIEEERFSKGIYCPHCGCAENIVRYGTNKNGQRYKCKNCSGIFTATSKSIFQNTHKDYSVWNRYIECMLDGFSIRKAAKECNISIQTSFVWRHKILDAITKKRDRDSKLKGVIEADETFFRVSYKGSRHLPAGRLPHKRGMKASQRGLSRQQVCVPCAVDREKTVISKVCNLGKMTTRDITLFYLSKVEENSIFVTDSEKSYRGFTESNAYKLVQIESGKRKNGIYHINHINVYHNNLKNFIYKFRGVSTKYLNNYLSWSNILKQNMSEVLSDIVKVKYSTRFAMIGDRVPLPLLAA